MGHCVNCKKESQVNLVLLERKEVCTSCIPRYEKFTSEMLENDHLQWSFDKGNNTPDVLKANYERYPVNMKDKPVACCQCGIYFDIGVQVGTCSYCLPCAFKYRPDEARKVYDAVKKIVVPVK